MKAESGAMLAPCAKPVPFHDRSGEHVALPCPFFGAMRTNVLRSVLPLLSVLCFGPLAAQSTIAEARQLPIGSTVTVSGVVTTGAELGSVRYFQDATAGIAAFPGTGSVGGFNPQPGHQITITGELKLFNGLLQVDPITAYTVQSTGNPLPAPIAVTPAQLGPTLESRLVRCNGCMFQQAGAPITSTTHPFTCSGETGVVFFRNNHPMIGGDLPVGPTNVLGVLSRFAPGNPPQAGYQVLPRNTADLSPSTIFITSDVVPVDITTSGSTLTWETNTAGASGVYHGPTAALGTWTVVDGSTAQHAVVVGGYAPASLFHARAFSVLGTDTAWSPTRIYSTASAQPGSIAVYFNKPVDFGQSLGSPANHIGSAMDDSIRAYMDRALYTLDIAVYNTTNNSMVNAANAAQARGVQVRWIAEGGTSNTALGNLAPGIGLLYRENAQGSGMHNKFVVVDAGSATDATVLTGSCNFTNAGFFLDANNLVVVRDQALAHAYHLEFEEMWGSGGAMPNVQNSRFGNTKTDNTPHHFNVGGTTVECYFSPTDGTTSRIRQALLGAQHRIEFALFAFTANELAEALLEKHMDPAVNVRGIINDAFEPGSMFPTLSGAGVQVVAPTEGSGTVHHKYAIVDHGHAQAGPRTITGSHNWSFFAENHNDENTLIIHGVEVADQFHQEWSARWAQVVGISTPGADLAWLGLAPNPVRDELGLSLAVAQATGLAIEVLDMQGRLVHTEGAWAVAGIFDHRLNVSHLPRGAYLLRITGEGLSARARFIRSE